MGSVGAVILLVALYLLIRHVRRNSVPRSRKVDPRGPRRATPEQRNAIWRKSRGRCAHCGKACFRSKDWHPDRGEIDHIKPWSWGGRTVMSNLQLLCGQCNHTKSNHYIGLREVP
jgi:5-methylcytosine-specific restriction endonuclease McrA